MNFDRKSFRWAMCVKPALLQRGFFCFRSSQLEVWGQICWSNYFFTELASFFSRARARACPPAPVKPRLRQKASTPAPSHITGKKAADEGKGGGSGFVEEGAMLLLGRIFLGGWLGKHSESLFATEQEIDWICTEASLDETQILSARPPGLWLIGESYSNKIYSLQKLICLFVTQLKGLRAACMSCVEWMKIFLCTINNQHHHRYHHNHNSRDISPWSWNAEWSSWRFQIFENFGWKWNQRIQFLPSHTSVWLSRYLSCGSDWEEGLWERWPHRFLSASASLHQHQPHQRFQFCSICFTPLPTESNYGSGHYRLSFLFPFATSWKRPEQGLTLASDLLHRPKSPPAPCQVARLLPAGQKPGENADFCEICCGTRKWGSSDPESQCP